jgi:nucleotide-binding universal stress UspA family protein
MYLSRKGEKRMYSNIVIASDGSGPSMNAARIAGEIAKAFSSSVTVVTVAYIPETYKDDMGTELREGYLEEWKRVLESTAELVTKQGVEPKTTLLRGENPAKAILDEIEGGAYDLLIVGRTGAGNPASRMMGGVSKKLIEGSNCAVLLVR